MSSYQVLARKWRPQVFEAVVGQDAITRTLKNALVSGRIAHAYLFAGPRGIGKTTTARLLARALLCLARTGAEPCGSCSACRDVSVDVIEIDGASNRGIEEIRTLRENVKYAPSRGRYKVYIIDEVHQLTEAAFNALLKTLEEPPPHVVFVLATTDPRDIPATVLSRVQRFDFRPIAPDMLTQTLERILTEEQIPFDPAALPAVVRAAAGSLRDALSLLDTAIAYGNGRLEADTATALLGTTAPAEVRAFAGALVAHETGVALEAIDRATREGEDLHAFIRDVIETIRLALVLKAAPTTKLPELTSTEGNELRGLAEPVSLDEVLYILRALLDADEMMRESPHPRVELEIATVRATRRPVPQALEEVLRRVDEAEARLRGAGPIGEQPAPAPPLQQSMLEPAPESRPARTPGSGVSAGVPLPSPRVARSDPPPSAAVPRESVALPAGTRERGAAAAPPSDLAEAWQRVTEEVNKKRVMLGAVLAQVRPAGMDGRALTLVLSGTAFHRDRLLEPVNKDILGQAVRRWVSGADSFNVVMEGETEKGPAAHPMVKAAIAEFQGEIVAVRARPPEGDAS
ncbi:MAG: DNA polymerase III subunit gamma/tau [Candidatus Rokuibacteriota bacterium]